MVNSGKRNPLLSRLKSGSALVDATTKVWYLYAPPVATVVQYYINTSSTSGGDGTTNATTGASRAFVNWADAKTAIYAAYPNFLAANVQVNIDVTGLVSLSTALDATGFVGDDTHFLQLRAASGQAHAGYYDVTKAGFTSNALAQIVYPVANYVRFDRLQIVNANSSVSFGNGLQEDATNILGVVISNCVIHRTGRSAGTVTGGDAYAYGGITFNKLTLVNNVISGSWFNGIAKSYVTAGSQLVIYNNTVIGATNVGISLSGSIPTGTGFLKNNRVEGGTACYALGSNVLTTATNFSSDTTSPDTAGRSKTGTFVDAAAFNYALASGDAGLDVATPTVYDVTYILTTDILGAARPQQGGWDVGAFETIVSTGIIGTSSVTLSLTGSATGTVSVTGTSSVTFALTGSATGAVAVVGTSSATFALTGSATATVIVSGTSSVTLEMTGSATGIVANAGAITGTSTITLVLTGSATATVSVTGTSSVTLSLTGSATGTVAVVGTSSVTFALTGSATGAVLVTGTSTKTFAITASATGSVVVTGTSTVTLAITGSATGTVSSTATGTSTVTLVVTGSATGTVSVSGTSAVTLSLTGSATGVVVVTGTSTVVLVIVGTATGIVVTPASYALTAREGAFAYAGADVTLVYSRKVLPAAGAFPFTGVNVTLIKSKTLVAGTGSFALTGKPVGLLLNGEYGANLVGQTSVNPFTGPFRV